jgi:hypothetical protein
MEIHNYKVTMKETQESSNSEIVYASCRFDDDKELDKLNRQQLIQKHLDLGFGYVRIERVG